MNKELKKGYLMVGGTFLPAMIFSVGAMALTKSPYKLNNTSLIAGVFGLILGGFVTAKMVADID